MTGVSLLQEPTAGDTTRRFSQAMGRVGSETRAAAATPAVTPTASDVRGAFRTLRNAVFDAVASASSRAAAGDISAVASPLVAAVAQVNDALDMLARSGGVSPDARASLMNAVRGAVSAVPAASASGLTLSRIDGKERLMIDTAAVEATLAKDPQALDALVTGEHGLPAALGDALAKVTDAPAEPPPRLEVAIASDRRAAMLRAASLEHQLWKLELFDVVPMRATLPARGRVDMLV
jgi:hypothetical protein